MSSFMTAPGASSPRSRAPVLAVTALVVAQFWQPALSADGRVEQQFNFKHDIFASDTGYYYVDGYEGASPELTMKADATYVFDQSDPTNWYHPLGFAFLPDGAHSCLETGGCPEVEGPGLKYFVDGKESTLDEYEPAFEAPREEWLEHKYKVELTLDKETIERAAQTGELFYFCHLHTGMSGRLKVETSDGKAIEGGELTALYKPYQPDAFDKQCGTYEVSDYAPGKGYDSKCADLQFLCGETESDFAQCMMAIDCKMNRGMRIINGDNPVVTFMRQMIPHHDNAVNMAKILLKIEQDRQGKGGAEVLNSDAYQIIDEDVDDLLRNIINTQNEQVTFMNSWLVENGFAPYDRRAGSSVDKVELCGPGPATTTRA